MAILGVNIKHGMAMARQALVKGAGAGGFQKYLKGAMKEVVNGGANSIVNDVISNATGSSGSTTGSSSGSASTSTAADTRKFASKLNEALAVGFLAPMISDVAGRFDQKYFANSPAEQTYATQLYTEIATRIGQSSKFPIARDIAQGMLQRLNIAQQANAQSTGASTGGASTGDTSGSASTGGSTGTSGGTSSGTPSTGT